MLGRHEGLNTDNLPNVECHENQAHAKKSAWRSYFKIHGYHKQIAYGSAVNGK